MKAGRRQTTIILGSGAGLLLLGLTGSGAALRETGAALMRPPSEPLVAIGSTARELISGAGSLGRLWQENRSLRDRLQAQTAEIARLKDQTAENQDLRSELGLPVYRDFVLVSSEITARSSATHTVTLARGTRDGLRAGMPVVKSGSLIGTVVEVGRDSARVRLLTDPRSRVPASVVEDHAQGMVSGRGASLELGLVPRDQRLRLGSAIVTSGAGETLPAGILIGTLGKRSSDAEDLFQRVAVNSSVGVVGLRRVFVITGRRS